MTEQTTRDRPLGPFFVLWTAQALSLLGSQAVQFALIWWLTARTGSAAVLAAATAAGLLPQVVLGPFIGALVDRWNRKRILAVSDAVVAAASAGLAVLFVAGAAGPAWVLAALAVRAVGGAFHGPAMVASTTLMVPRRHLTRVQGLNQAVQGGALIVTAPLGALLVATLPMAATMAIDVGTAAVAIAPLAFVRIPQPAAAAGSGGPPGVTARASTWREVRAGVAYLRDRPGHTPLLAMATLVNLCMVPAFSLLPLLVVAQGGGAARLGLLQSVFGAATITGGLLLGLWGGFSRRMHTALVALLGAGAATLMLGGAPSAGLACAGIALLGVTVPLINGPIHAVLQATVAPAFQGRVFTLYGSAAGAMAPLGLALAAPVAEIAGVRAWYVAGGLACLAMGAGGFLVRSVAGIEMAGREPAGET